MSYGLGQYLSFTSVAPLTHGDVNGFHDVFFFDRNNAPAGIVQLPNDVIQAGYPNDIYSGWRPRVIGVSENGRYISFVLTKFQGSSDNLGGYVLGRYDRQTNTRILLLEQVTATDPLGSIGAIAVSEDGLAFAWHRTTADGVTKVYSQTVGAAVVEVGTACSPGVCGGGSLGIGGGSNIAPSPHGPHVAFIAAPNPTTGAAAALAVVDLTSGARAYYPGVTSRILGAVSPAYVLLADGLFDRTAKRLDPVTSPLYPISVTADYRLVLGTPLEGGGGTPQVLNRTDGSTTALTSGDRPIGVTVGGARLYTVRADVNGQYSIVFRTLDTDGDQMLDSWETRFGLDPGNPADAATDSDGDGVVNNLELYVGSHPTALASAQRLFAEGAGGTFFDTQVHVFNPGVTDANVVVGFLSPGGERKSQFVALPPKGRTTLASCCVANMSAAEFSIVVESNVPVVAERQMTWDRVTGYGSHATAGAAAAATEWYFAEGATIADLQLFYLFSNPGQTAATVDVEYLLASGSAVTRQYTVAPQSRVTVWVNQEGTPLDAAEVSARIVASQPIVAERASYLTRGGQTFAAGSASTGITTPGTEWRFAEGATGDFFDTFLLVGNPGTAAVNVQATYQLPAGTTVVKNYAVAPKSRLTIWVDQEDPLLASTAVSTVLTATGNVVAERAMWWPGAGATWAESHTEVGATATATKWAVADAVAGKSASTSTFLLLSNPGATAGRARVTLYTTEGVVAGTAEYELPATSRTTAWLVQDFPLITNGLFSAIVESLPGIADPAVPIAVERASYSLDFAAGSAATATPIP